jgi:hypothetical protein
VKAEGVSFRFDDVAEEFACLVRTASMGNDDDYDRYMTVMRKLHFLRDDNDRLVKVAIVLHGGDYSRGDILPNGDFVDECVGKGFYRALFNTISLATGEAGYYCPTKRLVKVSQ